jgi:hypothetical protein
MLGCARPFGGWISVALVFAQDKPASAPHCARSRSTSASAARSERS